MDKLCVYFFFLGGGSHFGQISHSRPSNIRKAAPESEVEKQNLLVRCGLLLEASPPWGPNGLPLKTDPSKFYGSSLLKEKLTPARTEQTAF